MKYCFVLLAVLITYGLSPAQRYGCGFDANALSEKEQQAAMEFYAKERLPLAKTNARDSIAVTIHVIESVTGAANITYVELESEIKKLNQDFSRVGVIFFICGSPRYITGDRRYNPRTSDPLHAGVGVPNTINIYYAEELEGSEGTEACGYAYLPFGRKLEDRYIMMRKSCANDGGTLTHEMGHYYGLYHTHDTPIAKEFVDGSNCTRGGDQICDTSADPNLGLSGMMSGCRYVGTVRDPKGMLYSPPVSNFMSYASSACYRSFTAGQVDLMTSVRDQYNAGLASECNFYPDFAVSSLEKQIAIRSDQDITIDYHFENIAVDRDYEVDFYVAIAEKPEDDGFILLRDKVRFTPGHVGFDMTYDIDFPVDRGTGTYYLKAYIDSEYQVIERTESNNYATTPVVVDNSNLSDIVLFPNPVQDELKLFFRDKKASGKMYIRIFRYDGRLVFEDEVFKGDEEFFRIINVRWMPRGLYVVAVDFDKVNTEYSFKFMKQ